eukprot:7423147-Lingulodinium_polyedra.AAC.1
MTLLLWHPARDHAVGQMPGHLLAANKRCNQRQPHRRPCDLRRALGARAGGPTNAGPRANKRRVNPGGDRPKQ